MQSRAVLEDLNSSPKYFVVLVPQFAFSGLFSKVVIWSENTFVNFFDITEIYFLLKMPDVCYRESYKSSVVIFDILVNL